MMVEDVATRSFRRRSRLILKRTRDAIRRHGVILMYHRVATPAPDDPDLWSLCVSPDHFAQQLDVLRRRATVVPLDGLIEAIPKGRRSRPPVAITFDDGYADNLYAAKPRLAREDMPATLFVASGYTGWHRPFWSDELVRTIHGPKALPHRLRLILGGTAFEWQAAVGSHGPRTDTDHDPGQPDESRRQLVMALWHRLRPLPRHEQVQKLEEIKRWAEYEPAPRRDDLPLSADELHRLAADGPIEIGAHSVTHCELPALPPDEQMREIAMSKNDCEAIVGRPVTSFAYPYGRFNDASMACVRNAGFARACSTQPRVSIHGTDPFRLPRLGVKDWDGEEFERRFWLRFHE